MPESLPCVLSKFEKTLNSIKKGGTNVYEVQHKLLTSVNDIKIIVDSIPTNSVIWQHTPKIHLVAIKIKKGTGFNYSRRFYELIHKGIDSPQKFKELWYETNYGNIIGEIPRMNHNFTQSRRKSLKSFIVADTSNELASKYIKGNLPENTVDRTHLIPFPITGIENNPAVIIDYDGWLNRNPMQKFENEVLRLTNKKSILWITSVFGNSKGLNLQYLIYDPNSGKLLRRAKWIDDRWHYYWYSRDYQRNLLKGNDIG